MIWKLLDLIFNPDDLVQQRTIVFTRTAMARIVGTGGVTSLVFDGGGEGKYTLELKLSGESPGPSPDLAVTADSSGVLWADPYTGTANQSFVLVPQADGSTGIRGVYHSVS
ncbi:hypothetical protein ACFVT6_23825 [Streptomyces sp. NPDC058049]|uniref:hypothetical protein n=1 Tax=Streptomyces sp. NPDC058049 TaxID=3346314 RepID=UPI0036EC2A1A